jgi:uncharacterized membrane protein
MGKLATAFVLFVLLGVWTDDLLLIIVNLNKEQAFAAVSFQYVCWVFALVAALMLIALNIQNESKINEPRINQGTHK